jgi:hypothetical protein
MMLDASSVKPTAAAYPTNGQARTTITKAASDVLVIGQVLFASAVIVSVAFRWKSLIFSS